MYRILLPLVLALISSGTIIGAPVSQDAILAVVRLNVLGTADPTASAIDTAGRPLQPAPAQAFLTISFIQGHYGDKKHGRSLGQSVSFDGLIEAYGNCEVLSGAWSTLETATPAGDPSVNNRFKIQVLDSRTVRIRYVDPRLTSKSYATDSSGIDLREGLSFDVTLSKDSSDPIWHAAGSVRHKSQYRMVTGEASTRDASSGGLHFECDL